MATYRRIWARLVLAFASARAVTGLCHAIEPAFDSAAGRVIPRTPDQTPDATEHRLVVASHPQSGHSALLGVVR